MKGWGALRLSSVLKRVCQGVLLAVCVTGVASTANAALSAPWTRVDVGAVGAAGSANDAGGVFTITGSGTDIGNGADQLSFVYQALSGDGEIVARVTGVQNTSALAKAGVMIRETLTAGSRHVAVVLTPAKGTLFLQRSYTGNGTGVGYGSGVAPGWVRVVRKGNTFSGYRSSDGANWAFAGQVSIAMGQSAFIGLAVTSNNNTVLNTSTFDNVRVTGGSGAPPPTGGTPKLSTLVLNPTSVTGGASSQGTVTLTAAAPSGGAVVTLSSSQTSAATVPASVIVAAGATSANFTVSTAAVSTTTTANIAALYGGVTEVRTLTVAPRPTVTLTSLAVAPTSVQGGVAAQGTVTLSAAAPSSGAVVQLSSSSSAATVPASVTVPSGSTSSSFAIGTAAVSLSTTATINGNYGGASQSATLTLTPGSSGSVTGFFVAPNGTASGDGSINRPWDLATALAHPAAVKPGATIWLRGGTYRGTFKSYLKGSTTAPIIVRQYPGERATIDANVTPVDAALRVYGNDTWYWGFEVTNSSPNRNNSGGFNNPALRATSIYVVAPRAKFINLIVHDGLEGFDFWSPAVDAEIYGSLVYNVGVESPDRGHGHSIYVQNTTGTKHIIDNILMNGFSFGIHAYTGSDHIDNLNIQGNAIVNHGVLSQAAGAKANIYFGGGDVPNNPTLINNYVYATPGNDGRGADLDGAGGCTNLVMNNNYVVSDSALEIGGCGYSSLAGNTFYGQVSSQVAGNTFFSTRPTGTKTFIRPNKYEPGRANIIVYNWDALDAVNVDVSSVLKSGDAYEVRNAANFWAAPVLSGTYSGAPLALPMNGLSVAAPIGWSAAAPTGPDFNVFVLIKK